ncbi:MAG: hypothetical protein PHW14_02300 [Candidatus Omnitrophica bacterium]|nr:hypothetical protein [Candidatus Omnitrophota bacterium]
MKSYKMLAKLCLVMTGLWVALQVAWYFMYETLPLKDVDKIERTYKGLSSDELQGKLDSFIIFDPYRVIAASVLCERKDPKVVPYLIRELKSWNRSRRSTAMMELGKIGDERAIAPLMKIATGSRVDLTYDGVATPDYIQALESLAKMKYKEVRQYAVEFAALKNDLNDFRAYGITMLEYLEDPQAIPLLLKISKNDPEDYIRHKAQRAIDKIEAAQLQE